MRKAWPITSVVALLVAVVGGGWLYLEGLVEAEARYLALTKLITEGTVTGSQNLSVATDESPDFAAVLTMVAQGATIVGVLLYCISLLMTARGHQKLADRVSALERKNTAN